MTKLKRSRRVSWKYFAQESIKYFLSSDRIRKRNSLPLSFKLSFYCFSFFDAHHDQPGQTLSCVKLSVLSALLNSLSMAKMLQFFIFIFFLNLLSLFPGMKNCLAHIQTRPSKRITHGQFLVWTRKGPSLETSWLWGARVEIKNRWTLLSTKKTTHHHHHLPF